LDRKKEYHEFITQFLKELFLPLLLHSFSIYLVFLLNPEGAVENINKPLTFAGIYGLSAIGLNVHFGWTGLLNFGHASFMGMGAYVTLLLMPHAAGREGEVTDNRPTNNCCCLFWYCSSCSIWITFRITSYKT
jgi:ABC-type branched-subunit amino acid transport system permease subunit